MPRIRVSVDPFAERVEQVDAFPEQTQLSVEQELPQIERTRVSERDSKRRIEALIKRAKRARTDPVTFFSFVMREERTKDRLVAAAHQRLVLQFVRAYDRSVIRMPPGFSKTFLMAGLTLQFLGLDPTERGALISSSQGQAMKPFSMVQDYIADENQQYPELHLVFPNLQPSPRPKDPWTQTKLCVQRPPGIRDPSLVAIGIGGKLPGSRLSWIVVDDILDGQNTDSPANRASVNRWFNSTVLSRRDLEKSKIVVTNTPWHPADLTYQLEGSGWPTLTLSIDGEISIANAPEFDCEEIRRSFFEKPNEEHYRLAAHDDPKYIDSLYVLQDKTWVDARPDTPEAKYIDMHNEVPLWPEKADPEKIAKLRAEYAANPNEFNQLYRCRARDEESARCKVEWIQKCKENALSLGGEFLRLVSEYRGPNLTVTGVDLAIGEEDKHAFTAYFTFEVIPAIDVLYRDGNRRTLRNARRILDVDVGRYRGREIVDRLIDKTVRYQSIVRVETNAAQMFIKQWTLDLDSAVPVRAHHTGSNKHHRTLGVAGLFIELENGAWIIPCDPVTGLCPANVQKWIEECLDYQPPPAHTGDILMASWLGRAQAREILGGGGGSDSGKQGQGSVAARISIR